MFGKRNGMFGKHHTKETREKMRIANTGRKHTKEELKKMSVIHKGKIVSEKTKLKIKKSRRKIRCIRDIIEQKIYIMSIHEFCETRPELNPDSMRKAADNGWLYHKRYKIIPYAANKSDFIRKSDENGKNLEVDNSVDSTENTVNR